MAENHNFENFEKYDMIICYAQSNEDAEVATDLYINRFPERRQPSKIMFYRLKQNLTNYGSFFKPRSKNYNKENLENDEVNVLASVEANPTNSCRSIENNIGISKTRVQKILRKHKYKPYKFRLTQHLHPGDAERRLIFCNWYVNMLNMVPNLGRNIISSDEARFSSSGVLNRHNSRFWSQENQHQMFARRQQGRFGLNVSCFILGSKIRFFIFHDNLSSARYLNILETIIPELLEDIPLAHLNHIYFQQDGAPSHNAQIIRPFLENHFPNRWIGTNGPIRWPPRSPDLSVLDFFLWGYMQNKIYQTPYNNIEDLTNAVTEAFQYIQDHPIILFNALGRIGRVCEECITQNGQQFEHFF